MTALTANREVDRIVDPQVHLFDVLAATTIYKGGFVGMLPTGYVRPFVSGDLFVGIAYEAADNSLSSTSGDTTGTPGYEGRVKCWTAGEFVLPLTSVADTQIGKPVYATDSGALALYGHPDAFVGRILNKNATNYGLIRLRTDGDRPEVGCVDARWEHGDYAPLTGAVAGSQTFLGKGSGFHAESALGLGVLLETADDIGALKLQFDAVAEVAFAAVEHPAVCVPTNGAITFECEMHVHAIGDDAALDVDWGVGNLFDATSRASFDGMTSRASFRLNGNSANILAQSDDATTDTGEIDTTADNVTTDVTGYKKFLIIVRTDGTVEFYIAGARVLSSTSFAVLSTDAYGCAIQAEKTSNDTVCEVRIKRIRFAGAGKAST